VLLAFRSITGQPVLEFIAPLPFLVKKQGIAELFIEIEPGVPALAFQVSYVLPGGGNYTNAKALGRWHKMTWGNATQACGAGHGWPPC
jgi:hypothetical protein